jgi:hypothetical protein
MKRRNFLGVLLATAVAPKTMFMSKVSPPFVGGRVDFRIPQTVYRPERIVMKYHSNSLYGKFSS